MQTDRFNKIAILIDADNAQASKMEDILKDVSTYGRVVTKRAYGNWTKLMLKPWENEVKRFAIGTIQQFDFASGKNASDMALTIDAMDLLHTGNYDCFVIVSSDSDFTTLAIKIHESGVFVIGYGNKQTVDSFRNACDEFNYVEDLSETVSNEHSIRNFDVAQNNLVKEDTSAIHSNINLGGCEDGKITIDELDNLLRKVEEKNADDDGYVNVSSAGSYIKRVHSDFNISTLGYNKLPEYLRDNEEKYEVVERQGKGVVKLIMYRSKNNHKSNKHD